MAGMQDGESRVREFPSGGMEAQTKSITCHNLKAGPRETGRRGTPVQELKSGGESIVNNQQTQLHGWYMVQVVQERRDSGEMEKKGGGEMKRAMHAYYGGSMDRGGAHDHRSQPFVAQLVSIRAAEQTSQSVLNLSVPSSDCFSEISSFSLHPPLPHPILLSSLQRQCPLSPFPTPLFSHPSLFRSHHDKVSARP